MRLPDQQHCHQIIHIPHSRTTLSATLKPYFGAMPRKSVSSGRKSATPSNSGNDTKGVAAVAPDTMAFLIRSIQRNDVELTAVDQLNDRLHKLKQEIGDETILLDLGSGKIALKAPIVTVVKDRKEIPAEAADFPTVPGVLADTPQAAALSPKLRTLCIEFLERMRLRRRLLNRLFRRLLRTSATMDMTDSTVSIEDPSKPPVVPRYGEDKLRVDMVKAKELEQLAAERTAALAVKLNKAVPTSTTANIDKAFLEYKELYTRLQDQRDNTVLQYLGDTAVTSSEWDGPKIAATQRNMSAKEKEAEFMRWKAALWARIPLQPTFQEIQPAVFNLETRVEVAAKEKAEKEEAKKDDDSSIGVSDKKSQTTDSQDGDVNRDNETNVKEGPAEKGEFEVKEEKPLEEPKAADVMKEEIDEKDKRMDAMDEDKQEKNMTTEDMESKNQVKKEEDALKDGGNSMEVEQTKIIDVVKSKTEEVESEKAGGKIEDEAEHAVKKDNEHDMEKEEDSEDGGEKVKRIIEEGNASMEIDKAEESEDSEELEDTESAKKAAGSDSSINEEKDTDTSDNDLTEKKKTSKTDQEDDGNDNVDERRSTKDKENDDQEKHHHTKTKVIRPISLIPVPSFYEQDWKRIKLVHAELMSSSMQDFARRRTQEVVSDYNQGMLKNYATNFRYTVFWSDVKRIFPLLAALRKSNELSDRRTRLYGQLNALMHDNRKFVSQVQQNYKNELEHAYSQWNKRRQEFESRRLQFYMPNRGHPQHRPNGTPLTKVYSNQADPIHRTVAFCLADILDTSIGAHEKGVQLERFTEEFQPPQRPDIQSNTNYVQNQITEERLKKEYSNITNELRANEEERQKAWKRMMKTKAEFEMPHGRVSLDMNNYSMVPLPSLREGSSGYASNIPSASLSLPMDATAVSRMPISSGNPASARPSDSRSARPSTSTSARSSTSTSARPSNAGSQATNTGMSDSKYSAARVRERISSDGTVAPVTAPKQTPDGLYVRPAGRTRKGMDWDAVRGIWVPVSNQSQQRHRSPEGPSSW